MTKLGPPWVLFCDKGKAVSIMPAMRLGDVVDVSDWPEGLAQKVVNAVNAVASSHRTPHPIPERSAKGE